jgi:hypothetical protein
MPRFVYPRFSMGSDIHIIFSIDNQTNIFIWVVPKASSRIVHVCACGSKELGLVGRSCCVLPSSREV